MKNTFAFIALIFVACTEPPLITSTSVPRNTETPVVAETLAETRMLEETTTATVTIGDTSTPTEALASTVTSTSTVAPSITPTTTPMPTFVLTVIVPQTPQPTPTPLPNANLLVNPGFEGISHLEPGGFVFNDWRSVYCDGCSAPFQGTKNPDNLLMAQPEFKRANISNRVHNGETAQQWFCAFRVCEAYVLQPVVVVPGANCVVEAWVQSWASPNFRGDFLSHFDNDDGYSVSLWNIRVAFGDTNDFQNAILKSDWFSLPRSITEYDGRPIVSLDHYDKYALMRYEFVAPASVITVFLGNVSLFPFQYSDRYVDSASLTCDQNPTPVHTATPSEPVHFKTINKSYRVVVDVLNVRPEASTTLAPLYALQEGDVRTVLFTVTYGSLENPNEVWGCIKRGAGSDFSCDEYVAVQLFGQVYMVED